MSNFTTRKSFFLYSFDIEVKEREKIDKFLNILEKSNVHLIVEKALEKESLKGRNPIDPYNMLAVIIYGFAFDKGTVRDLERNCKLNLAYIYIMNNEKPTYATFSNYINNVIVPNRDAIFFSITKAIIKEMNINISDVFIDGSKFEANANKYKFVWKPTNKIIKLSSKIKTSLEVFGINDNSKIIKSIDIANYISQIKQLLIQNDIDVVNIKRGKGIRLSKYQKHFFLMNDYLIKQLDYEEQSNICGPNRNSYFKTDYDATAMCLKEDYYSGLGSNMHAGYNVQFVVCLGLIIVTYVCQDRNDYLTLIPLCELFKKYYGFYPQNCVADAGYGSFNNYQFLNSNNIGNYVKFSSWEGEKSGKKPSLFKLIDNNIFCLKGSKGEKVEIPNRHPKSSQAYFYKFKGCSNCLYKSYCKKNMKNKKESFRISEINPEFLKLIDIAKQNLLSVKGIELRVNRSVQAEGNFGNMKQNLNYERFRRRGLYSVSTEMMLMALGVNLRKLFRYIEKGSLPSFWSASADLKPETFNNIKISKPRKNSNNEINRKSYKKKYKKRSVKSLD